MVIFHIFPYTRMSPCPVLEPGVEELKYTKYLPCFWPDIPHESIRSTGILPGWIVFLNFLVLMSVLKAM